LHLSFWFALTSTEAPLRIYCDTSTLLHNIRHADPKSQRERAAITQLAEKHPLFRSLVVLREVTSTHEETQRECLIVDYEALKPVPRDEKVLGICTQTDQHGGFFGQPLVSDVQDEEIRQELIDRGLTRQDATHIAQAVYNDCDVFLTRDEDTIIKPHGQWLENRFPPLKVRLPSQLLEELRSLPGQ
jgi:predicted nucleic acid-binding protein